MGDVYKQFTEMGPLPMHACKYLPKRRCVHNYLCEKDAEVCKYIPQFERTHSKERPLNKLTAQEYRDDFLRYLKNVDESQEDINTYFNEYEHQEGPIAEHVKMATKRHLAKELMIELDTELENIRWEVYHSLMDMMVNPGNYDHPNYATLIQFVEGRIRAIARGLDKY